ncbi:MAG TPA: phenylalanine--tRNA ligase subunit beta [Pirellulaceae bacterium]|nr:phenylalanine--tRNA ligase subunit beta [Pirellulaceae bacterium]
MIVSWNWLKEYVRLDMSVAALTDRLMMTGLNLEEVGDVEGDMAIDLEVTSNRPDCLSHIGVARETCVLFDRALQIPAAAPVEKGPPTSSVISVENSAPELCPQYFARLVRGVKIAPSPDWMQRRLKTLGIRAINNVVDISNYVLMECGQPLHAFDFDKLDGGKIVVRRAAPGEKIAAIDQRHYELTGDMCVIADARRPVAIAGVMGGLDTEIGTKTANVLIETAEFVPLSVRATARRLGLSSDSSYRFERGIDRQGLDWASRRCAQLILELAGGEICSGSVFAGVASVGGREPIMLRLSQISRILGIEIPKAEVVQILKALGLAEATAHFAGTISMVPPSWRRDLTREIDLIEEVARIHGYEKIPEDVLVPLEVSKATLPDQLCQRLADGLLACGFFEAVTLTFVDDELARLFRPWSDAAPLRVEHSSRQRENILRQSLIPSLLSSRRHNERQKNHHAQLFEIARVFLAADPERPEAQPNMLGFVSGKSFAEMKGIVEMLVARTNREANVAARPCNRPEFAAGRGCELLVNGKRLGWLGEIADDIRQKLDLQDPVAAAELDLTVLEEIAIFFPPYSPFPEFMGMHPSLNFVMDEAVSWQELEDVVRQSAGPLLESVKFESQYRGQQIPANKKSYVLKLGFRAADRTLTGEEVEAAVKIIVSACHEKLSATLR